MRFWSLSLGPRSQTFYHWRCHFHRWWNVSDLNARLNDQNSMKTNNLSHDQHKFSNRLKYLSLFWSLVKDAITYTKTACDRQSNTVNVHRLAYQWNYKCKNSPHTIRFQLTVKNCERIVERSYLICAESSAGHIHHAPSRPQATRLSRLTTKNSPNKISTSHGIHQPPD